MQGKRALTGDAAGFVKQPGARPCRIESRIEPGMKIHPLITTTAALEDLCGRLAKAEFITVDTEFMRENTFWPELCLVQIADSEEAAAIDPLAPGIDLAPLQAGRITVCHSRIR